MQRRIGLWALIGFAVACCWVIFAMITAPNPALGRSTFVAITAPAAWIGRTVPLAYYWFILLNAVIYALVGLAAEPLRRPMARHFSN